MKKVLCMIAIVAATGVYGNPNGFVYPGSNAVTSLPTLKITTLNDSFDTSRHRNNTVDTASQVEEVEDSTETAVQLRQTESSAENQQLPLGTEDDVRIPRKMGLKETFKLRLMQGLCYAAVGCWFATQVVKEYGLCFVGGMTIGVVLNTVGLGVPLLACGLAGVAIDITDRFLEAKIAEPAA